MGDTYFSLNVHYVFGTRHREPLLRGEIKDRLWAYMGGIANHHNMKPLSIGGTSDHVHALLSLPTTMTVAKAAQLMKGNTSAWLHETFSSLRYFAWQSGYGAFTVSASQIAETIAYIKNQEEHHRFKSFQEEYISFLKRHGIVFEDRYL